MFVAPGPKRVDIKSLNTSLILHWQSLAMLRDKQMHTFGGCQSSSSKTCEAAKTKQTEHQKNSTTSPLFQHAGRQIPKIPHGQMACGATRWKWKDIKSTNVMNNERQCTKKDNVQIILNNVQLLQDCTVAPCAAAFITVAKADFSGLVMGRL